MSILKESANDQKVFRQKKNDSNWKLWPRWMKNFKSNMNFSKWLFLVFKIFYKLPDFRINIKNVLYGLQYIAK